MPDACLEASVVRAKGAAGLGRWRIGHERNRILRDENAIS